MEEDILGDGRYKLNTWLKALFRIINRKIMQGGISKAEYKIDHEEARNGLMEHVC